MKSKIRYGLTMLTVIGAGVVLVTARVLIFKR